MLEPTQMLFALAPASLFFSQSPCPRAIHIDPGSFVQYQWIWLSLKPGGFLWL